MTIFDTQRGDTSPRGLRILTQNAHPRDQFLGPWVYGMIKIQNLRWTFRVPCIFKRNGCTENGLGNVHGSSSRKGQKKHARMTRSKRRVFTRFFMKSDKMTDFQGPRAK